MNHPHRPIAHPGFSLVGLLITMVCIVVLFSILMTSMNKAVTGQGSQQETTVRSFEDKLYLTALFQSMVVHAGDNKDRFLTPSQFAPDNDPALNTTANMYSAMVMQQYTNCHQLISGNEYSGFVTEYYDYDHGAYNPQAKVYWDPNFQADLSNLSHVSFAHVPLYGERLKTRWRNDLDSRFPLLGNRGPKNGMPDPDSYSYGRDRQWRGHLVFGDGHIDFVDTFTPSGLSYEDNGEVISDNIFHMDEGPNGADAILSFTKKMNRNGPELQYD